MAPSLSVIVVCRNYERYVAACLQTVLAADQEIDLVFVDNGSKDRSVDVARSTLHAAPPHIKCTIVPVSPEVPLCKFFNIGVAASNREFVKVISADDKLGPNFFTTFRQLVSTSDSRVGAWLAGSVIIDENDQITRQYYSPALFGSPDDAPPVRLVERHVLDSRLAPLSTAASLIYRRQTYLDVGGYDERFRYEDRPFLFNVIKAGWEILVYPFNNTYYRVHSGASSADPAWMAEARLPILVNHTLRAEWRNKPLAAFHLARAIRVVSRNRWRTWRAAH